MSSETAPLISGSLAKGTYAPSTPSDLRSPCPFVNCLANHGYIPRDGRNVHASELRTGLKQVGMATGLSFVFANAIFSELRDEKSKSKPRPSLWQHIWYLVCNPWAILLSQFALRPPGQKDAMGRKCINLDQIGLHDAIEHDVSLSRYDIAQGDNHSPQPELIQNILNSSSDGGTTLSIENFAAVRRQRIEKQREINPDVNYGPLQNHFGCTEISLVLNLFGDGHKVPHDYVRAFFQEERLPIREGWKKNWWPTGIFELEWTTRKIKKFVGLTV